MRILRPLASALALSAAALTAQSPLTTNFLAANGNSGNMFDIVASNAAGVTIGFFDVNIDPGTWDMAVYKLTIPGPFTPSGSIPGNWTLVGSATGVVSNGVNVPTLLPISVCEYIPSGATQGFYVTVTNGAAINYTIGTAVGAVAASNADLAILQGVGVTYPFAPGAAPRVFNTNLYYAVGPNPNCGVGGFASKSTYGIGCYDQPRMAHELFPGASPIDLVNTNWTMIYQPGPTGGTYTIIPGSFPYDAVTAAANGVDLLLTPPTAFSSVGVPWDDGSTNRTLPFAFDYPNAASATTTQITINSNGRIYLGFTTDPSFASTGANSGFTPTSFQGTTGAGLPVIAGFMCDLDATVPLSHIWYEDPSPSGGVRITWDHIPNWQDPPFVPLATLCYIQMELLPGGLVNLAYGSSLGNGGSVGNDAIVGFSAGGGQPNGAQLDWSTLNGYLTGSGIVGLKIDANARPVIGTTITLTVSEIPTGSLVAAIIYGFTKFDPGIPLNFLQMPGCQGYVSPDLIVAGVLPGTTYQNMLGIPANPTLAGYLLVTQGLVLNAAIPNPFNGITSNGLQLLLGGN